MNEQSIRPAVVNWLGYLAVTLLLILPLSVLMVRNGDWQQGLLMYAIACLGSTLLIILAIVLLLRTRFNLWRKDILQRALFALPGAALLLALTSGGSYPTIHDITTDTADPPRFTSAASQRGADSNSLEIDEEVIQQQQEAYPNLQTLVTPLPIEDAYRLALKVATDMGWDIYRQDINAMVIEAVDTTGIMGFKDDVVVRVRSSARGTLVDLRSVSRVGEGDLGANAARINAFVNAFQQQE